MTWDEVINEGCNEETASPPPLDAIAVLLLFLYLIALFILAII